MIPLIKPFLDEREADAAREVILSGWLVQGPKVREFEERFSAKVGSSDAVAVSSGTSALHLSLVAGGVKPGDEVLVPSLTYIACANVILHTGATPVFVDVDPLTFNMDVKKAAEAITDRTSAIMLVHQVGMPADLDEFRALAKRHRILLIEDAACAIGSTYKGKPIGSDGRFVTFSFHPRKLLTTGDGGMIAVQRAEDAVELRLLREHGMSVPADKRHASDRVIFDEYVRAGYNYRLTDIQAAVGIEQLSKVDAIVKRRRELSKLYEERLRNVPALKTPSEPLDRQTNWQSYICLIEPNAKIGRNDLMQALLDRHIATRRAVQSIHREPVYREYANRSLPETERVANHGIILPLYHTMTDEEHRTVCDTLGALLS